MKTQTAVEQRRERKTEEQVLAEILNVLEFAKTFFAARGKAILVGNISAQITYFNSAQVFQHLEDTEDLA